MNFSFRPLTLLLALTPVLASAQTLDEYLKLRKKHGITRASEADVVETFVGKKVLEIKGTIKGVIGSSDGELLMIEGPSRVQRFIKSVNTPDWLKGGQVQARLIVEASRATETSMLEATLLGAAGESEVAAFDAKAVTKPKATNSTPSLRGKIGSSRKGSRPASMPGSVPKAASNPIKLTPEVTAEIERILPSYMAFIKNHNKKLSDAETERIARSILSYSTHFGVDARLIVAIIITESDFNPRTRSRAGAIGLGQLMPVNVRSLGLSDGYDIEQNLWGTVRIVRGHLERYSAKTDDSFEALVLSLAGYNAGSGAVRKHGGVPPYRETQNYIKKVIARYQQLCGK